MRDEELYVAGCPDITDRGTAEVAEEGHVGDNERGQQDKDEGSCPSRDLVRTDAVCVLVGHGGING